QGGEVLLGTRVTGHQHGDRHRIAAAYAGSGAQRGDRAVPAGQVDALRPVRAELGPPRGRYEVHASECASHTLEKSSKVAEGTSGAQRSATRVSPLCSSTMGPTADIITGPE